MRDVRACLCVGDPWLMRVQVLGLGFSFGFRGQVWADTWMLIHVCMNIYIHI